MWQLHKFITWSGGTADMYDQIIAEIGKYLIVPYVDNII